ncbi:HET-domain-containing protein [Parathielavia hyrcaniae]|uniref:HET-domain-containing protein n=1 Tax=Parathielavia hyrcaniae TaxID=113614 RepID=A0AAN6QAY9_9PEZI|nr:HET-domain-containing protein [Parathielavia hyrcaniae]
MAVRTQVAAMQVLVKYTVELRELTECDHKRDCESLRTNSRECTTCYVLLSLLRLHLACRCEWRWYELSRADDFIEFLPTSEFVQHLAVAREERRRWWQLKRRDRPTLPICFWALWRQGDDPRCLAGHPIVRDLVKNGGSKVSVGRTWSYWTGTSGMASDSSREQVYGNENRLLNHWLLTSIAKRPGCAYSQLPDAKLEPASETALPTRVLDLMPNGLFEHVNRAPGSAPPTVRLVIPPPGSRGRYLTLSHRWGTKHLMRLTKANLGELQKGIELECLPRTYRDAAKVAAQLGYRYLWIDALCIVQDDPEDWLRESAEMCTVYRNSCCTIFAHTSSCDDDGFLEPKIDSSRDWPSTINNRGWVFQERILSRRILHFSCGGVFFEDASGIYTSHLLDGQYFDRRAVPPGLASNPLLDDQKPNLDDSVEKPTKWYELVEKYTTECELTFDTDRLPAVQGLARYYHELNPEAGAYAFGLWLSSLHQGLLWVETDLCPTPGSALVPGDHSSSSKNVPQPPSWSWAGWRAVRYPAHLATCEPVDVAHASPSDHFVASTHPARPSPTTAATDCSSPAAAEIRAAREGILRLRLRITHWRNVTARRQPRAPAGQCCPSFSLPKRGPNKRPEHMYDLVDFPARWPPVWVALDGERGDVVQYGELSLALLAVHVRVKRFAVESDDVYDERQHVVQKHYGDGVEWYRRVGVGAVAWRSWWDGIGLEDVEIE